MNLVMTILRLINFLSNLLVAGLGISHPDLRWLVIVLAPDGIPKIDWEPILPTLQTGVSLPG